MDLPRRLSEPGPLIEYLQHLLKVPSKKNDAREVIRSCRAALSTHSGRILLEFLEKSTLETVMPVTGDVRALEARNSQSFIALDLRRILSDEFDAALCQ